MRKINLSKVLIVLFFVASLSSCSSDSPTESYGKTTGDYFPMKITNKWNYTTGSKNSQIDLTETNNFDGEMYYKFKDAEANTSQYTNYWMKKIGASYFQKSTSVAIYQGSYYIILDRIEVKMLQDDLQVGQSWSGAIKQKVTYTGPITTIKYQNINYTGLITARDATVTLGDITYTNVIKSTMTATYTLDSETITVTGENWYAKDIGLIYDSSTSSADNITKARYLTGYTLH